MQRILAVILFFGVLPATVNAADQSLDQGSQANASTDVFLLHLVVATDDDFLSDASKSWCSRPLEKAILRCRELRPATEIRLQILPAGSPMVLNHGRPKTGPRRAVCFLCDASDRVLGLCVGVPTPEQLLTLLEEKDDLSLAEALQIPADELADSKNQERDNPALATIRERVAARTIRHYRPLLDSIHPNQPIRIAGESLQSALAKDIAERFLLTAPTDYDRLVSIQQHAEAYRYWCDAMLPCLYGRQVDEVWQELLPIVWKAEPWRIDAARESLPQWYDEAIANGPVILEILSDKTFVDQNTKVIGAAKSIRAEPQTSAREDKFEEELSDAVVDVAYRKADLADLAAILQRGGNTSLDILNGANEPPRWVVLESKGANPIVLPKESKSRLLTIIDKIKRL